MHGLRFGIGWRAWLGDLDWGLELDDAHDWVIWIGVWSWMTHMIGWSGLRFGIRWRTWLGDLDWGLVLDNALIRYGLRFGIEWRSDNLFLARTPGYPNVNSPGTHRFIQIYVNLSGMLSGNTNCCYGRLHPSKSRNYNLYIKIIYCMVFILT